MYGKINIIMHVYIFMYAYMCVCIEDINRSLMDKCVLPNFMIRAERHGYKYVSVVETSGLPVRVGSY